jgi:hypothetical protein
MFSMLGNMPSAMPNGKKLFMQKSSQVRSSPTALPDESSFIRAIPVTTRTGRYRRHFF